MKQYHYVYKLTRTDNGEFYIGMRSSSVPFEQDEYWGSGTWTSYCALNEFVVIRELVASLPNRNSAKKHEKIMIKESSDHPLCMNLQHRFHRVKIVARKTGNLRIDAMLNFMDNSQDDLAFHGGYCKARAAKGLPIKKQDCCLVSY